LKIEQSLPNFLSLTDGVKLTEDLKREIKKHQKHMVKLEERAQYIERKNSDILLELQIRIKVLLDQTKPDS